MHLRTLATSFSLVAAALSLAAPARAQTKVFTSTADFNTGTLNNVAANSPANQVVLGPTPVAKTTIVWSTNYTPGYVVRLDTTTGKQTGRFPSALVTINGQPTGGQQVPLNCNWASEGNCPGRVTVDTNGDVWIVNRAFGQQGTLSKFSGDLQHCIDRNNNGTIETSSDKNNNGIIDMAPAAGEYFGQDDECVLTTIPVGPFNKFPRGVAVDKHGKIWVSTFVDGMVYRYNPNEPVTLEATVNVGGNPYSIATGGDFLFISNAGAGGTKRVHIESLQVQSAPCPTTYGIVGDPSGGWAWLGGWGGDGIYKANFNNNTCVMTATGGGVTATTLDLQGNVWGAKYGTNQIIKLNPAGVVSGTYPAGGVNPHGLSVDFQGFIWIVTHSAGAELVKMNPANGAIVGQYSTGDGILNADPYIYSDFTGVQINRQAPYAKVGSWDGTFDGGGPGIAWSTVSWNAEPQGAEPAQTTLILSARAADTVSGLGIAAYAPVTNGGALSGVVGRYVQVRAELKGPGYTTAVLSDLTVVGPCPVPGEACCAGDGDCTDADSCTIDTCPTPGGTCQHAMSPSCCLVEADCDDQNACTLDSCPVPGASCAHDQKPNCCSSNAECADGDLCTADICSGPGGTCSHPIINGCCNTDLDCAKGNACSDATCPLPGGFCIGGMIPGCCGQDADCADLDLCTQDTCDIATSLCTNASVEGCCNVDGECNDNDACTADQCTGPGGICAFSAIPACCSPNDPLIGTPCDLPVSPYDKPPCKAGQLACDNGAFICTGSVKPELEVCDHLDNNCDGVVNSPPPCPVGTTCFDGICAKACQGEFGCLANEQCVEGYCVPTSCDEVICPTGEVCIGGVCKDADAGTETGAGGAMGAGGGAGAGSPSGSGGAGDGGSAATATTTSTSSSTETGPSTTGGASGPSATGSCGCEIPGGASAPTHGALALAALALSFGSRRRNAPRQRGAAAGTKGVR